MKRYVTTLTMRLEYDAADTDDALEVERRLEDSVRVPSPGRNAELLSVEARTAEA